MDIDMPQTRRENSQSTAAVPHLELKSTSNTNSKSYKDPKGFKASKHAFKKNS